jgi:hypothetical protein
MSVQLNLLPDIKKTYLKAQRTKSIIIGVSIIVTIAAGGLVLLAASFVYGLQPALISSTDNNITKKVSQLKSVENIDSYLTVQNQLTVLTGLHDQKPIYSRLFDYLKVLNPTPPNTVSLSSLQVNRDQKLVTLVGTTASYESFTVFIDTLKNAQITFKQADSDAKETLFSDIAIDNQSIAKDGTGNVKMNFTIRLTYNENAFSFTVINAPNYDPSKLFDANAKQQGVQ